MAEYGRGATVGAPEAKKPVRSGDDNPRTLPPRPSPWSAYDLPSPPPAQLGAARGSPRRISAGVTPAPERSERAHGHPRSNFAKGIPRVAPSVSRTLKPRAESRAPKAKRSRQAYARATVPRSPQTRYATSATNSASSGLGTSHSLAHLRHFRNAPRVLLLFASAPTYPHSGQVSATGLSQTTKSQFG